MIYSSPLNLRSLKMDNRSNARVAIKPSDISAGISDIRDDVFGAFGFQRFQIPDSRNDLFNGSGKSHVRFLGIYT